MNSIDRKHFGVGGGRGKKRKKKGIGVINGEKEDLT